MFAVLAVICTGIFAGAAAYVTLVEHPARIEGGAAFALTQFGPSYRRAAVMQALLAVVGCGAALLAWLLGAGGAFLLGGLLLGAIVPFTLVVIYPVNARLLDPVLAATPAEADGLLVRWARLHAVRSGLSLLAFLVELAHLG